LAWEGQDVGKDRKELPPFALRLKALREEAGITQGQLAEKSGLHLGAVFKLEQGVRDDPSWSTVRALADALGVDCTAFADCEDVQGEDEKPAKPAARGTKATGKPKGKRP